MKINSLKKKSLLISLCILVFSAVSVPLARSYDGILHSPISVKILMKKDIFKLGEPIEGKIVLANDYPATIPATFWVRLFHDGELTVERFTAVKQIFSGETEFSWKNFGIPDFDKDERSLGDWRLLIVQRTLDEEMGAEVTFKIIKDE